jgi:hypothetical protein
MLLLYESVSAAPMLWLVVKPTFGRVCHFKDGPKRTGMGGVMHFLHNRLEMPRWCQLDPSSQVPAFNLAPTVLSLCVACFTLIHGIHG